jgi:hypothetical protein
MKSAFLHMWLNHVFVPVAKFHILLIQHSVQYEGHGAYYVIRYR